MDGSLQQYLDLLQRFAQGLMDVEEFTAGYWSIRFRRRMDRGELEGAISKIMQPFERDILGYTPDLEPEVRATEDRELRRRAAQVRRTLMGNPARVKRSMPGGRNGRRPETGLARA